MSTHPLSGEKLEAARRAAALYGEALHIPGHPSVAVGELVAEIDRCRAEVVKIADNHESCLPSIQLVRFERDAALMKLATAKREAEEQAETAKGIADYSTKALAELRSQLSAAEAERDELREPGGDIYVRMLAEMREKDAQLQAAREAMGKVPHLATVWTGGSIHVGHEDTDHARNLCRELGGQCALAAIRESKEGQ